MRRIINILTSRWFVTLIAALVLAVLLWFCGPWIGFGSPPWYPLTNETTRLAGLIVITFAWGLGNLIGRTRVVRANQELVQELRVDPDQEAVDSERSDLAKGFEHALERLGKTRFDTAMGGRLLYQLPWYLMIGPPGTGKTTALVNSGLSFPVRERGRKAEIRGVGGTRNCDWFFTSQAILIDTAGRYTTQDSHTPVDQGAWEAFLDLLKKYRPRQPINGVLTTISASDLLSDEATRGQHAIAIRDRLAEISDKLGVDVPVYLMITKGDLIAGFTEFFDDLDNEQRQQVWGATFDLEQDVDAPAELVRAEFERLVERLERRRLDRLHHEIDQRRRALIFDFPCQVSLLRQPLESFVDEAFATDGWKQAPRLRGIYLTSGTQEGTPVDRLVGALARTFGVQRSAPSGFAAAPRPFFLSRLLQQVIFGEAGLVAHDSQYERNARLRSQMAWIASGVVVLLMSGLWWASYDANVDRSLKVRQDLRAYAQLSGPQDTSEVSGADLDLSKVLPPLDKLRNIPTGPAETGQSDPWTLGFGLSQRERTASYTHAAYERALYRLFLPRLLLRLENDLHANINDPDYVYEALKAYLLLGQRQTLYREDDKTTESDKAFVQTWLGFDWEQSYSVDEWRRLQLHLASLLALAPETETREIPLDGGLVKTARETLTQLPLSRRAYQLFSESAIIENLPGWRASASLGNHPTVFRRRSGQSLDQAIPGQFTYDVFHDVVLDEINVAAVDVDSEYWVLGRETQMSEQQFDQLIDDMHELYYNDYIRTWDNLLSDITLKPLNSLHDAMETTLVLSQQGTSPLQLLMESIVREVSLTVLPPEPEEDVDGADGILKAALKAGKKLAGPTAGKLVGKAGRLAKLAGKKGTGAAADGRGSVLGQPVEAHFAKLKTLVQGTDGVPPTLGNAMLSLNSVYTELLTIRSAEQSGQLVPGRVGASELEAVAQRLPAPLNEWLGGLAATTASSLAGTTRNQLDAFWKSEVLPLCHQALDGRFPFTRSSNVDVNIDDFVRLFSPGGTIDGFFNTYLRARVDTTSRPWQWRPVDGQTMGISDAVLSQFERAARIRDGLFSAGSTPRASFELKPAALDAQSSKVRLDIDGQNVEYSHGPPMPARLIWPGPAGQNLVRLTFSPLGGSPMTAVKEGAWSWFRLLNDAQFQRTNSSDRFAVTFSLGSHSAAFELKAGSVANPFDLTLFQRFRCPVGF